VFFSFLSINNHFFFLFSFVWCEIAGEKDEEYFNTPSPSPSPTLSHVIVDSNVTENVDLALKLPIACDDMDLDNVSEAEITQHGEGINGRYLLEMETQFNLIL
jgi:hypothetical protein